MGACLCVCVCVSGFSMCVCLCVCMCLACLCVCVHLSRMSKSSCSNCRYISTVVVSPRASSGQAGESP